MTVGDLIKPGRGYDGHAYGLKVKTGVIVWASWAGKSSPSPHSQRGLWDCKVLWSDGCVRQEDAFYLERVDNETR